MSCDSCGDVASDDPDQRPTPAGMVRVKVIKDAAKFVGIPSRSLYGRVRENQFLLILEHDLPFAVQTGAVQAAPLPEEN